MKVLFIGGTGIISSACSRVAIERGIELYHLRRGQTRRPVPAQVKLLAGDCRDLASCRSALGQHRFDAVVDFIAFTPAQVAQDIDLFRGRTGHFVFISSASAYQTPPARLPVSESTPLDNPVWAYSRDKIACEERLLLAYRQERFPCTIVRPSHTYDRTLFPCHGGYTVIDRMRKGKPVVVHGDGTSLWTLTHHEDFARAFVPLLGDPRAFGDAFHITSDEWLTWDQIHLLLADAAETKAELVHLPSEIIARHDPEWGDSLLGDKAHSMVFDNSKLRRLVPEFTTTIPFASGSKDIVDWYREDPSRCQVDPAFDVLQDRLAGIYSQALAEI